MHIDTDKWAEPIDPTPFHRAARHLRIWRRFLIIALAREAQFRANAFGTIATGIAQIVVSLIPVLLLFDFTEEIEGWSRAEVIALLGLFQIVMGVIEVFLQQGMMRISELVTSGDLDGVLVRPMSSQFYVTLRWISPSSAFGIVAGIVIFAIGMTAAGASPGPFAIVAALVSLACGLILLACAWSAMVYIVFWATSVPSIAMIFSDLLYAAGYPVQFFPGPIRIFLTVVFPAAFVTTVPIEQLVGRAGRDELGLALAATVVAVLLIRWWWRFTVRSYASASS